MRRDGKQPRIKPVFVMNEPGVTDAERAAVLGGLQTILGEAGVENQIDVEDYGVWRQGPGRYESVDWYVAEGKRNGRRNRLGVQQLNAASMMSCLATEPWRKAKDHYDLFVCSSDLWTGEDDNNFVIGLARQLVGTVISVQKFRVPGLDERTKRECVKTETIHEMGHVFGLLPYSRAENVEYSLGKHCANRCTMRQGLRLPDDWVNITQDRLKYGTFCPQCQEDLRAFFRG
jgi:predicted Zn-dependent protease